MADNNPRNERIWEKGWAGHEKAQLIRMARLTFQEKIIWLEEAQVMLKGLNSPGETKVKKVSRGSTC